MNTAAIPGHPPSERAEGSSRYLVPSCAGLPAGVYVAVSGNP